MKITYDPKTTSLAALELYLRILDHLTYYQNPKFNTILKMKEAIESIKDKSDREEFKKYFNDEFGGTHTEGKTAWEYYKG